MNTGDEVKALVEALERYGNPFEHRSVEWVSKLESGFGHALPDSFRQLISQYVFPEFDAAGVTFFSNLNDGSDTDITVAPFSDPYLSPWLIRNHFVQFGRPDTGSYDPVCLDLSQPERGAPVVVLDHEDILMERREVHLDELAHSFVELIQACLHNRRR